MIRFIFKNFSIPFLALAIIGIALYLNILPNSLFWDDNDFILNNAFVKNFDITHIFSENIIAGAGFVSNYWRPLLSTIFAIEWQLFGDWYPGYHAVSILFHVADGLLLFYILKNLFPSARIVAFFVSLIFLIHPLQVEAVAYANSLGDSLSVFFIFLGIIGYLKFNLSTYEVDRLKNYFLALFFFVLAIFSKETAIILPALIVLIEFLFYAQAHQNNTNQHLKRIIFSVLPFFILAGIYIYLRATVLNFDNTFNFYEETTAYTESIWIRILTFLRVLGVYFGLLVLPVQLHYERTLDIPSSLFSLDIIIPLVILIALIGITIINLMKSDFVRLNGRYYIFALGWFLIGLAPTSGIAVPINNFLYEHWLYLPQIGFFLFFAFLAKDILHTYENAKPRFFIFRNFIQFRTFVSVILVLFLIFFSIQTIKRNADWRNPINFYLQTLEFAPESGRSWNNLGTEYAKIGELEKAKNAYFNAIPLIPQNPGPYNNLGNVFAGLGDLETAAVYWRKSVELNPDFFPPRQALMQYEMLKSKIVPGDIVDIKFK